MKRIGSIWRYPKATKVEGYTVVQIISFYIVQMTIITKLTINAVKFQTNSQWCFFILNNKDK